MGRRSGLGIFHSEAEAVIDARQAIGWLSSPIQDKQVADDEVVRPWRDLGDRERDLLSHLLRVDFPGREQLLEQLHNARVRRTDKLGTLGIFCLGPPAELSDDPGSWDGRGGQVAVEGFYLDDVLADGALVHLVLRVVDGKLDELKVYKEGDTPLLIDPYEIDLSKVYLY